MKCERCGEETIGIWTIEELGVKKTVCNMCFHKWTKEKYPPIKAKRNIRLGGE